MNPTSPAASTTRHHTIRRTAGVAMTAAAILASSVVAVAAPAAATPHPAPPAGGSMRDVAQRMLAIGNPGYLARINDGRRVSTTVAGVADMATGRALRADDQFEIGSNTKTFTATLILQLVDKKAVTLDAPVSTYLPGVVPNGDDITVRMLLNHTSGLFNYTGDPKVLALMQNDPHHDWTERELLDAAFAHPPTFAPGKGWSYSNTNYTLLGMIAQKLTARVSPTSYAGASPARSASSTPTTPTRGPPIPARDTLTDTPSSSPAAPRSTPITPVRTSVAGPAPPGRSSPPPATCHASTPPCSKPNCSPVPSSAR